MRCDITKLRLYSSGMSDGNFRHPFQLSTFIPLPIGSGCSSRVADMGFCRRRLPRMAGRRRDSGRVLTHPLPRRCRKQQQRPNRSNLPGMEFTATLCPGSSAVKLDFGSWKLPGIRFPANQNRWRCPWLFAVKDPLWLQSYCWR